MFFDIPPHATIRLAVQQALSDMGFTSYRVAVMDDPINRELVVHIRVTESERTQEVVARCVWGLRPSEVTEEIRAALSALDRTYELKTTS